MSFISAVAFLVVNTLQVKKRASQNAFIFFQFLRRKEKQRCHNISPKLSATQIDIWLNYDISPTWIFPVPFQKATKIGGPRSLVFGRYNLTKLTCQCGKKNINSERIPTYPNKTHWKSRLVTSCLASLVPSFNKLSFKCGFGGPAAY